MSTAALKAASTGQSIEKRSPQATLQHYFDQHKGQIIAALPKHLNADRMCRLAMTAMSQNPALTKCDVKSIFGCVITASQLGLEIGVLGQCYLVPYKQTATLVPGWKGLVDLVARAGRASAWTGAVFEGDEFSYALGDSPYVRHVPCGENDPKKLLYAYAVGRVQRAEWPIVEVWPAKRIWQHRDRFNKVGGSHYSFQHQEMYARKVVLLQVLKYLPMSIELTAAVELSERQESGAVAASIDGDFMVLDGEGAGLDDGDQGEGQGGNGSGGASIAFLHDIEKAEDAAAVSMVLDEARRELSGNALASVEGAAKARILKFDAE